MASTHSSIVPGSLLTAQLIPDHELRRAFEVNVIGPMSLTRRLLPSLRAAQGRIVNIGAISAQTTPPFFGAAGATKSALASFNDALRMECAKFGVEVVLIEPGALKTDIFATAAKTQVAVLDRASKQVLAIYKGIRGTVSDGERLKLLMRGLKKPQIRSPKGGFPLVGYRTTK